MIEEPVPCESEKAVSVIASALTEREFSSWAVYSALWSCLVSIAKQCAPPEQFFHDMDVAKQLYLEEMQEKDDAKVD